MMLQDYLHLTKPRIIALLLVTTFAAMLVAARGPLSPALALWTLLGGALAAGAANAINCYLDRDVDAIMSRTRHRPLPSGRIEPRQALILGIGLSILSFVILGRLVNLLSAILALAGILFYVFVYTLWLKRSTVQNIVIGGAAGAVPPLVGWAAVADKLDLTALILFGIVFLWTPPHFWALALNKQDDYRRANIPMLPVVRGEAATKRQIVLYSALLVLVSLLLYPLHSMGWLYLAAATLLGLGFLALALVLLRDNSQRAAWRLFSYSMLYLALLFAAMVVDSRAFTR